MAAHNSLLSRIRRRLLGPSWGIFYGFKAG
jgi:hypothetical protein